MKIKNLLALVLLMVVANASAQSIYEIAELGEQDLNGTSRYIGMGGAMGALGGDLSVMGNSPAATALYRKSDVSATMSYVVQPDGIEFNGKDKNHVSFDQIGFVYCAPVNSEVFEFVNFGINYHKVRNFNQLTASTTDMTGHNYASQTWQLADLSTYWGSHERATPLANMAYESYLLSKGETSYEAYGASGHLYNKASWGSNQAFDFNLSFNVRDRWYFGLTATLYNVTKKSSMIYTEDLVTSAYVSDGYYTLTNENKLKGLGYDVKLGAICRPIDNSNFKVGLTLTIPTTYELTCTKDALLYTEGTQWTERSIYVNPTYDYDYKIRGPWRLGVSMGNTFFGRLAVGAEYEFADYSSCSVSYGDEWDDWDVSKDRALNREADRYLNATHTLKVGAEYMPMRNLFVRAGYNYVTSSIDNNAYLNQYINSASIDASTSTDYMNTSGVNRYTLGVGVKFGSFYADAAWQYQCQKGTLYTFDAANLSDSGAYITNACPGKRMNLNRYQLGITLGYRF